MTFLKGAVQNPVLVGAVMGWFVAQVLKTLIHLMITREFVWERMIGSGDAKFAFRHCLCIGDGDRHSIWQRQLRFCNSSDHGNHCYA